MTAPRECRPPEGTESGTWHWVRDIASGALQVMHWSAASDSWAMIGVAKQVSPAEVAASEMRYVAPCLPPQVGEGV